MFVVVMVQSQVFLFFKQPLWVITKSGLKTSPKTSGEATVNKTSGGKTLFPLSS
jgi:hypothetical protein